MRVVFSVLHYQAIEVTRECINNLLLFKDEDIKIIIVDNASPNNSGDILEKEYEFWENIYVLKNSINEGFAKGNNLGYKFAKEELNADIIVVMNNDVMITQKKFVEILREYEYKDDKVDIIAPDILSAEGNHQNPFRIKAMNLRRILQDLLYNLTMIIVLKIPYINIKIVTYLESRRKIKASANESHIWKEKRYDIVPHGAIIIYRKKYIEIEEYAFSPITFLFGEEDLLYKYVKDKNYLIVYDPKLRVLHLEDVSIKEVTRNELKRRQFLALNKTKSLFKILNDYIIK